MTRSSDTRKSRAQLAQNLAHARELMRLGRFAAAIAPLSDAAELDPDDAALQGDLGLSCLNAGHAAEALRWLRRAAELDSASADIHYNLALALEACGHHDAAITACHRVVTAYPNHAFARAKLADLLFEKGESAAAVAAYAKAAESAPGSLLARKCELLILLAEDRSGEAEAAARALLVETPSDGGIHHTLGRILRSVGRFDEATRCFETSIDLDPWNAAPYYAMANTRKFGEPDRGWVARIESRLNPPHGTRRPVRSSEPRDRMLLHFAVAKILDDLGSYEGAMAHYHAANALRQKLTPFDPSAATGLVDRITARFTREFLLAHRSSGPETRAPILIVGMPRSGTTLVERILSSHPSVRARGEVVFWTERGPKVAFADDATLLGALPQIRDDYVRALGLDAADGVHVTDKMPFNFLWLGLVTLAFPRARIVHCRRDPVDTCLSAYKRLFRASWGFESRLTNLVAYYRLYARVMNHWRSALAPDRVLDVRYEALVTEPEETSRRLVESCGLEWHPACLRPDENAAAVRTANEWQARQPIFRSSVGAWRRYEPWIAELIELADEF